MFIFEACDKNDKSVGCGSYYTIMLDVKAYRRTKMYKIIKEEMQNELQNKITKRIHHWRIRAVPREFLYKENAGYIIETIVNQHYKGE